jgi:hypothetical protein
MTRAELIAAFRLLADDTTPDYLWSDPEIEVYLAEAEAEAAIRARLLIDSTTAAYCSVAVVAGTASYALHANVLDVVDCALDGKLLARTSREDLNQVSSSWPETTGTPTSFFTEGGKLVLYPNPAAVGVLSLVVVRLPVRPMGVSPEIPASVHFKLLDWALKLAYSKRDTDTESQVLAEGYAARFADSFGAPVDANVQRKQAKHRPAIVMYGGF